MQHDSSFMWSPSVWSYMHERWELPNILLHNWGSFGLHGRVTYSISFIVQLYSQPKIGAIPWNI